ncbi:AsmA-like C-terminal region-containing protein [Rhodobacter sp. SY28-1]|uniref:AsmA-like C-terminal region-containing protein n=1 Tax=Rhodobacter sp. SY28-1 TaxID=2562317 RepID=UPI0010BFF35D|nr:AsmA-like C-terminal region-containing protein [Rhodobacter sp. SY28-1]
MQDQSAGLEDGAGPVAAPPRSRLPTLRLSRAERGPSDIAPSPPVRRPRRRGRLSLTVIVTLVVMALAFGYLTLSYTGKTLRLPTWSVAEIEARLNESLDGARLPKGSALSLGAVELAVDSDFVPRFRMQDIRLIASTGRSLLTLPEASLSFDPTSLLSGKIRPSHVRLTGARIAVRRDAAGRIDLQFEGRTPAAGPRDAAAVLAAVERLFASPTFASLQTIEAEGLTLNLTDDRAGRSWQVGDGRLVIENGATAISAELGLTLLDGADPAQAVLTLVSDKDAETARLAAKVDNIAATDLAAMAPPLAFLAFVDAPISGRLEARLDDAGSFASLSGTLGFGAGSLAPGRGARPVAFDRASLSLSYDPFAARIDLANLSVESASLRLTARGHGDLLDALGAPVVPGALPDSIQTQIAFDRVMVDPEGLFEAPVRFNQGALDLRLRLDPFRMDIGQLSLVEGDERLLLSGSVAAEEAGWGGALDLSLNQIATERLLKVWPVSVVPRTRVWFADNVGQGQLTDVQAALRLEPGGQPQFNLSYEFFDTEVRFVRTLPPILNGRGHSTLDNKTYLVALDQGHVIAPEGGRIEADGTVFQILDITQRPATAKVDLVTSASLTATLSLLDQEPFSFFSKAGQPYNLGDGRAELQATILMPMKPKIPFEEVNFTVAGTIRDFTSPVLVPGRILTAPEVAVAVNTDGLQLAGKGKLDLMPVDLTYLQGFGPEQKGRARVNGTVMLSDAVLRDFGVELPAGSVRGEGPAAIDVAMVKDEPPQLTLTSNLTGLALRLDALGWSKGATAKAALDLEATLSRQPVVERLTLKAAGLDARGRITTRENGGLDKAEFDRVVAGDWLDAPVTLTGRGKGAAVDVALTGGTLDMRRMPEGDSGAGGGGPIRVRLDALRISEGIRLTDFRGDFGSNGGFNGTFTAGVNGSAEIAGVAAPAKFGTAVRITSQNAGAVMAAAGIFDQGRGGTLDMTMVPRGPKGEYSGKATFTRLRVQGAPALAELLSAVSVVGLLEQMNGEGLAFNNGEVSFILSPKAVEITQGSAVGASLGISFAGLYLTGSGRIDLQGVISPIYLVNGVGQILTRRGEGLFGFNYRLTGTTADPNVSVNPLSVLTPGMFRELFRQRPPNLKDAEGDTGG